MPSRADGLGGTGADALSAHGQRPAATPVRDAFFVRRTDLDRLFAARAACYVISGYDGSGNYGDVLQVEECLRQLATIDQALLPVPLVSLAAASEHVRREAASRGTWGGAVPLFYADRDSSVGTEAEFTEVEVPPPVPSALLLAGGGFLNEYWGAEKVGLADAVIAWQKRAGNSRSRCHRPLAVGQQVSPWFTAEERRSRFAPFIEALEFLGVRDFESLELLRTAWPEHSAKFFFSGDETTFAVARLSEGCRAPATDTIAVNFHISLTLNPWPVMGAATTAIDALAVAVGDRLRIRLFAAHEDAAISELEQVQPLIEHCERSGIRCDAFSLFPAHEEGIGALAAGMATVSCSYHVALTSLLMGIPAVLLQASPYYRQKHDGLGQIFGLPADLVLSSENIAPDVLAQATVALVTDTGCRARATRGLPVGALAMAGAQAEAGRRVGASLRTLLSDSAHRDLETTSGRLAETLERLSELRFANNELVSDTVRLVAELGECREREAQFERAAHSQEDVIAALGAEQTELEERLRQAIADRDVLTADLQTLRAGSEQRLGEKDRALAEKDRALAARETKIAEHEAVIARLRSRLPDRVYIAVTKALGRRGP
jgi:hypothetical protein